MKSFLQFLLEDIDLEQQSKLLDRKNRLSNLISKVKEGTRSFDVTKLEQRLKEIEKKISEPSLIDFNMALLECSLEFEFYYKDRTFKGYTDNAANLKTTYNKLKTHLNKKLDTSFKGKEGQITYTLPKKKINVATDYHAIEKVGKDNEWFIELDTSLSSVKPGVVPVEVVTPWFPAVKLRETITHFKKHVYDVLDGTTNDTTSMHISFRIKTDKEGGERNYEISPIKLLLTLDQRKLLETFKRSNSFYSRPFEFESIIKRNFTNDDWDSATLKQVDDEITNTSGFKVKYHAISFQHYDPTKRFWRIEVRGIGDAYLHNDNIKPVFETCETLVEAFAKAIDRDIPDEEGKKKIKDIVQNPDILNFSNVKSAYEHAKTHGPSKEVEDYLIYISGKKTELSPNNMAYIIYYFSEINPTRSRRFETVILEMEPFQERPTIITYIQQFKIKFSDPWLRKLLDTCLANIKDEFNDSIFQNMIDICVELKIRWDKLEYYLLKELDIISAIVHQTIRYAKDYILYCIGERWVEFNKAIIDHLHPMMLSRIKGLLDVLCWNKRWTEFEQFIIETLQQNKITQQVDSILSYYIAKYVNTPWKEFETDILSNEDHYDKIIPTSITRYKMIFNG